MTTSFPWTDYWNNLVPRFTQYLEQNSDKDVEQYLVNSFGFIAYHVEDFASKVTKNKKDLGKIDIFAIETMDIARSLIQLQSFLHMAPLALMQRTVFEIYVNHQYIVRSKDSSDLATRFYDFKQVEEYIGKLRSAFLDNPNEKEIEIILEKHPEWKDPSTGKLHKKVHWSGKNGTSLESLAIGLGLQNEYSTLYRVNSKFTHASPVLINLYNTPKGLYMIPTLDKCSAMSFVTMEFAHKIIRSHCEYFGVPYDEYSWALISNPIAKKLQEKEG